MSANVMHEDRFYGLRTPAWHPLGFTTDEPMSAEEVFTRLGKYYFEKRPVTMKIDGQDVPVGYGIVRSPTKGDSHERPMGMVTGRYNILQPQTAVDLFDEKVGEPVETMGMLGNHGRRMFITWTMPKFNVGSVADDEIKTYGFVAIGFNGKIGAQLAVVTVRVVCENTWKAAIAQAENSGAGENTGLYFTGKHTMKDLDYRLGEWMEHVQENAKSQVSLLKNFFNKLSGVPVKSDKEVHEILWEAFPSKNYIEGDYPEALRERDNETIADYNSVQEQYRDGIHSLFSGVGTAITPDYWGLFNAGTEYFNWAQMAKKPVDASIIDGNRARNMDRLAKVLSARI